jgi:hypothetical protein
LVENKSFFLIYKLLNTNLAFLLFVQLFVERNTTMIIHQRVEEFAANTERLPERRKAEEGG